MLVILMCRGQAAHRVLAPQDLSGYPLLFHMLGLHRIWCTPPSIIFGTDRRGGGGGGGVCEA